MKKYLLIIISLLLLTSCNSEKIVISSAKSESSSEVDSGFQKSSHQSDIYQGEDVTLSIKKPEITVDTKELTLVFENLSDNEYGYGKDIHLEIMKENGWCTVPTFDNVVTETILIVMSPHSKSEVMFSIKEYFGSLSTGKYRILKTLYLVKEAKYEMTYIVTEFEIK